MTCPSEHALLDAVTEQRLDQLAEHLDACHACREIVAELARGTESAVPERIGRFAIERVLGVGAMGVVYFARDSRLDRHVALKVLHAPGGRLVDEARAMARVQHDNLVTVYGIDEVDDQVAISMEYLAGGTLRAWLATPQSWRAVASVMRDVARGLAAIHAAGLVHRDVKPENILFDAKGRARVADLGLAALQGRPHGAAGTPAYMAPEQRAGVSADERTDQWSFFVCFYEVLTGRRPVSGAKPSGPRALQNLVARGLERDPQRRHPSMANVASELERLVRPRRAWLAAAAVAVAVPAAAFVIARSADDVDPCARSRDVVAGVWNPPAVMRLAAAYRAAGMSETGRVVARGIDEVSASLTAMHGDSCRATYVRGEQSAAMLDRRTLCLRERLAAVESLLARLASADRATLARGGEAVAILPAIDDCAATRVGARTAPTDPRAIAARLELARARPLRTLGQASKTVDTVEPLIALGVELRDHELVAEARLVAAEALADDLQLDRASMRFAEAELAAEAAGNDDLRARVLIGHASLVGSLQQKADAGLELLHRARAVVQRLGNRTDLENRALVAEAALAASRGDLAVSERLLRSAVATMPSTGPERWFRIVALRDLANSMYEQRRPAEAEPIAREAVKLAETTLGPDHVDVSETLSLLGLILHYVDKDDEARAFAARAIAIKERVRGRDHVSLSSTLMVLALIARDSKTATGHAEARRITDRVVALRRAAYGAENPITLAQLAERGSLAVDAGEHAIARTSFAAAIPGLERAWGRDNLGVIQARFSEAIMAERSGDPRACADHLAAIARTDIEMYRAYCLNLAGAHARANELVTAIGKRELAAADRAALDVLSARIALATGARERARALARDVDARTTEPSADLALDLAVVWAQLGDEPRASELTARALATAGVDLLSAELFARAAQIELVLKRRDEAAQHAARAIAIAVAAEAGPDMLARYRCLSASAAGMSCRIPVAPRRSR